MTRHDERAIPMTERSTTRRRGSYGVDAPYAPAFIGVGVIASLVGAIASRNASAFVPVVFVTGVLSFYLHTTLRGKFVVWAGLLDELNLRGDERILDLGCGRGAVLLMVAERLTTSRAVGVDLWRTIDQSGYSIDATRQNAVAEGVADRVELHTGDMTALPFEANSFDVVGASLVIHNSGGRAGRAKLIEEAVRVLRPGGRMLIADIRATPQHELQLDKIGMKDVRRRRLNWRFWWGGPWAPGPRPAS